MAENENKKSGAKQAADAAKTAVNVAKGAGRIAAGDVIGGVKDIAKDGNVQKIIVGVVGFITAMIVMMTSVVPSVLFTPSEDAFSGEHSFLEVLKQPVDSIGDFLKSIFGNKDTDTEKSMIDSDSIQVLADNTTTDAENASESAKNTMNNMLKETKERFNKRHEELIKEIPTGQREALLEVLANDPRPRYQNRPDKVYGLAYGHKDIHFQVRDDILTVCDVTEFSSQKSFDKQNNV